MLCEGEGKRQNGGILVQLHRACSNVPFTAELHTCSAMPAISRGACIALNHHAHYSETLILTAIVMHDTRPSQPDTRDSLEKHLTPLDFGAKMKAISMRHVRLTILCAILPMER